MIASVPENSHAARNYLNATTGIKSWLFTLDHKRIGVMYLIGILISFFLGGVIALIIRLELFTPNQLLLSEDRYNEFFTLHGAIMTFLFLIPSIPAALGNFLAVTYPHHAEGCVRLHAVLDQVQVARLENLQRHAPIRQQNPRQGKQRQLTHAPHSPRAGGIVSRSSAARRAIACSRL